jgi:pyridinium-3,5-biscarboxylic acid mononucleotide synthase
VCDDVALFNDSPWDFAHMSAPELHQLLDQFLSGSLPLAKLLESLTTAQTARLGHTEVDLDRARRCGFPEVIYGANKTNEQLIEITAQLLQVTPEVLITRVTPEQADAVQAAYPHVKHHQSARTLRINRDANWREPRYGLVTVLTAGTTDLPVAYEAVETAAWMGCQTELISDVGVAGPQRLIAHLPRIQQSAAVVVVAGMEGALPSMVGGYVACPVIGVPTSVGYGVAFGGLSALLTMLNSCVSNVTVVNIDAGFKGGYLAGLIAKGQPRPAENIPV